MGVTVLDIGTGTGILAVMAARAGATHVFACEVNSVLCNVAREVLVRCDFSWPPRRLWIPEIVKYTPGKIEILWFYFAMNE